MQIDLVTKKKIIEYCLFELENKLQLCQNSIEDLKEGISNETKSSAGDKFETAREMMQQEYEKMQLQIQRLLANRDFLKGLQNQKCEQVQAGSLVKCSNIYLLFIGAFGNIYFEDTKIHTAAINSPIGLQLKGLRIGEIENFKGLEYCIAAIT